MLVYETSFFPFNKSENTYVVISASALLDTLKVIFSIINLNMGGPSSYLFTEIVEEILSSEFLVLILIRRQQSLNSFFSLFLLMMECIPHIFNICQHFFDRPKHQKAETLPVWNFVLVCKLSVFIVHFIDGGKHNFVHNTTVWNYVF